MTAPGFTNLGHIHVSSASKGLELESLHLGNADIDDLVQGQPWRTLRPSYCTSRYLGEWYDTSEADYPSYQEQKAAAMHNCIVVASVYGALAAVCAVVTCYHSVRAKRS